jgi:hypothetical protein
VDRIVEELFHGRFAVKPAILAGIGAFPKFSADSGRIRNIAVIALSRSTLNVPPSAGMGGVRDAYVAACMDALPADLFAISPDSG